MTKGDRDGEDTAKEVQGDGKDSREGRTAGCSARVAWTERLRSGLGVASALPWWGGRASGEACPVCWL